MAKTIINPLHNPDKMGSWNKKVVIARLLKTHFTINNSDYQ